MRKIIAFIEFHGWATIRANKEIAQILGLLQNTCDIFPWGMAQLLIVEKLLRVRVKYAFNLAQGNKILQRLVINESTKVPNHLSYRLRYLKLAMKY